MNDITAKCCVVGGGPAGMMVGYLLARAGVTVTVLEKHADFLRDFRGDTIHPSTLQVMDELGLYERLLEEPHYEAQALKARFGSFEAKIASFSHLPARARFVVFMPQWDFLDFLAGEAKAYPDFKLMMETEATDLIRSDGRVAGVMANSSGEPVRILSDLVIGCDGRHSVTRKKAGLALQDIGAPMDVLWFRLSRRQGDPEEPFGTFGLGHIFITLNRGDYWQCAYVIAKGALDQVQQRGLQAFRDDIEQLAPFLQGRSQEVRSFDDLKLLTVGVDRLECWYRPGFLCIGDAAHTMSPIGGVGINLAIQDAVAAANILAPRFRAGGVGDADLAAIQRRREFPTRATQRLQVLAQNRIIGRVLANPAPIERAPRALRMAARWPSFKRLTARLIGLGFRPEHVTTPASG